MPPYGVSTPNEALIRHSEATFVMRAASTAMRGAGIDDGGILLVDRAVSPAKHNIAERPVRQLPLQGPGAAAGSCPRSLMALRDGCA
jgi:hypothetical protein